MNYRRLGRTDLRISEIGVGCSGFWGDRRFPEEKAARIIHEAFERGVNFFDTGHNYCDYNAEPRLGRAIRDILSAHGRDSLVISTKAGTVSSSASIIPGRGGSRKDFSPGYIEETCAKSIRNLGCGYLDIFQLHGIKEAQLTDELAERLMSMKEKGMFRCLGVNTHSLDMIRYVAGHPGLFDMVLIDYNVLQLDREPVIDELSRAGIGVVAGTVLAQGHLVRGKIGSLRSKADAWYLARAMLKPAGRRLHRKAKGMREILTLQEGMTGAQAAFAYVLGNPAVSSCVFGTTRVANLLEAIEAADMNLDEDVRSAVRESYSCLEGNSGA